MPPKKREKYRATIRTEQMKRNTKAVSPVEIEE